MLRPLDEWDEEYIAHLPLEEDYRFDRKRSSILIDAASGRNASANRNEMSVDVSAFANSGGGYLIYGVANDGVVDGGIPIDLKGGTAEWLDASLATLTDRPLRNYRVKCIKSTGANTKLRFQHAIYVVAIPDSEEAPHQALDRRYYIRMNGHNEPAPHWMLEDIRRRLRGPKIEGYVEFNVAGLDKNAKEGIVQATLWPVCQLLNTGTITAQNLCVSFEYPEFSKVTYDVRNSIVIQWNSYKGERRFDFYVNAPLHPNQLLSLRLGTALITLEAQTLRENQTKKAIDEISFTTTLYVENAFPIPIDASFASKRVSENLRRELAARFDWDDPDHES